MQEIPDPVLQYLSTSDSMVSARIAEHYPDLQEKLSASSTRKAILKWLGSEAAWEPSSLVLLINCLGFIRGGAIEEASIARPFVLHTDPFVRIAAFEFLLALYYPDKNPDALLLVFQNMLSDKDDKVRSVAAHYIQTLSITGDLKEFLERWYMNATSLDWNGTESYEIVGHLLQK